MELTLYLSGHAFRYEVESMTRMFFHGARLTVREGLPPRPTEEGGWVLARLIERESGQSELTVSACLGGQSGEESARVAPGIPGRKGECERVFAVLLCRVLTPLTGVAPSWGVLTGIRPVKLVHGWHRQGMGDAEITRMLTEKYLVAPGKAALALETAGHEAGVLARSRPESYSLYVSVPFCPTR